MAPLRTYLLPAMAAVAAVNAVSINDYVPSCAPDCFKDAVENHSNCDSLQDNECLCKEKYSLKLHIDKCTESSCDDAEFGE